jgi:hypothetical protein
MKLTVATLCDAATVRDGLLHILGAGVSQTTMAELPAVASLTLAAIIQADITELRAEHRLSFTCKRPSGNVDFLAVLTLPPQPPGEMPVPVLIPVALPLNRYVIDVPGRYEVMLTIDDLEPTVVPFVAIQSTVMGVAPSTGFETFPSDDETETVDLTSSRRIQFDG